MQGSQIKLISFLFIYSTGIGNEIVMAVERDFIEEFKIKFRENIDNQVYKDDPLSFYDDLIHYIDLSTPYNPSKVFDLADMLIYLTTSKEINELIQDDMELIGGKVPNYTRLMSELAYELE